MSEKEIKSNLFQNRYRIKSLRLPCWDYSKQGYYFVTICSKNFQHIFGEIVDGKIRLSKIGEIVEKEWLTTPRIRKNIQLDEWILMPNHLHGIIVINNEIVNPVETPRRGVSTKRNPRHNPQWKPNSLGAIICQFKSICTKRIRKSGFDFFAWQPRFYDRIIRNENEAIRIREYIHDNPLNWNIDSNNHGNPFT